MRSPADASPLPSRAETHGSGPMRVATPSSCRTCTDYSLPVSRRTNYPPPHQNVFMLLNQQLAPPENVRLCLVKRVKKEWQKCYQRTITSYFGHYYRNRSVVSR